MIWLVLVHFQFRLLCNNHFLLNKFRFTNLVCLDKLLMELEELSICSVTIKTVTKMVRMWECCWSIFRATFNNKWDKDNRWDTDNICLWINKWDMVNRWVIQTKAITKAIHKWVNSHQDNKDSVNILLNTKDIELINF